jgi:YbgC/YbaW family acyl-CoA thioester hydrolase
MMHATRYYEYFEDAFLDWLDARGGYDRLRQEGADLVVKASGCEHHSPARLGDVLAVESAPARVGTTSITMTFTMRRAADVLVAVGTITYVCVRDGRAAPLPAMLTAPDWPRAAGAPGKRSTSTAAAPTSARRRT